MTAGRDLLGGTASAPRRRGRPPGSGNKRAKDLKGWVETKTGSTAAMQSAQLCLVTVKELKAAGGDHARAVVAKASGHVAAYVAEAERLDGGIRAVLLAEMADLVERAETAKAEAVLRMVSAAIERLTVHAGRFTLAHAVEAISEERRALMPYTDQRQPQVVHAKGEGFAPVMVLVGGSPGQHQNVEQKQGTVIDVPFEVLQPKSHDDHEG